jgi:hypothetical protein
MGLALIQGLPYRDARGVCEKLSLARDFVGLCVSRLHKCCIRPRDTATLTERARPLLGGQGAASRAVRPLVGSTIPQRWPVIPRPCGPAAQAAWRCLAAVRPASSRVSKLACRASSSSRRSHNRPSGPGWIASPIRTDLICDRHRGRATHSGRTSGHLQ